MKKISFIIILAIIANIYTAPVFGDDTSTLSTKTGYELYEQRVTNHCSQYKVTDKSTELIYIINDDLYKNYDTQDSTGTLDSSNLSDLELAQEQYREVMDGIYDCATSVVYYKAYNLVIEDLIPKSGPVNSALKSRLTSKQDDIKEYQTKLNSDSGNSCKLTSDNNNSLIKKSVLNQTTYELCRYSYYLEYLKEVNNNLAALDADFDPSDDDEDGYESYLYGTGSDSLNSENISTISTMLNLQTQKMAEIEAEIENTYKVFPLAFQAYSDFENYITIHILLELLREAYDLLREEIHKSINPISQVVYKISNAMKY